MDGASAMRRLSIEVFAMVIEHGDMFEEPSYVCGI